MSDILNESCRTVVERLKRKDIFYEAFVSTVETGIKDFMKTDNHVSCHAMAEFIVQRITGEC